MAQFLGGSEETAENRPRPVTIVDAGVRKPLDVEVVVPVDDMGDLGQVVEGEPATNRRRPGPVRRSIWPAIHPRLLELVESHRSTLIFVNARRLSERLATRLNEAVARGRQPGGRGRGHVAPGGVRGAGEGHHGSLSASAGCRSRTS